MGFDSAGTFTRTGGGGPGGSATGSDIWQGDAAAGIKILAASHDVHDQDLANGLSQCLLRNGAGVPSADIPWGGRKITNLQNPSAAQDAATKHYVDNPDASQHARSISGAGLDGRLNFTSSTGVNGITWTSADLAWVAKRATTSPVTKDRLVLNNNVSATGTDVVTLNDDGSAAFAGAVAAASVAATGAVTAATVTATGTVTAGSNFDSTNPLCILSASNGGQILFRPNGPSSSEEEVQITTLGLFVTSKDIYAGTAGGNGGGVYAGLGLRERAGTGGGYGVSWINFDLVSGTDFNAYVGTTLLNVTVTVCDYRIKRDVAPLDSVWDRVRALKPISYRFQDYEAVKADDVTRWGFLAHEVQETLLVSAAKGVKDGEHLQSIDVLTMISALTCALQECMARIEALEAAA